MRGAIVIICVLARVASAEPGLHRLAVGGHHACMITKQSAVACWGKNASEQLGDGTREDRGSATRVIGLADVIEVAAGNLHTCALQKSGAVWCWGGNGTGQTGDALDTFHAPRQVQVPASSRIFAGPWSSCAAGRDGKLRCWGQSPIIGKPTTTPTEIAGVSNVVAVGHPEYSGNAACVASAAGIDCWGSNWPKHLAVTGATRLAGSPGRLLVLGKDGATSKIETTGKQTTKQSAVDGPGSSVELAGTQQGACAIDRKGAVRCTLGGNYGNIPFATVPADPKPAIDVGTGETHACALHRDGTFLCWGTAGVELGDGARQITPNLPAPSVPAGCDVSNLAVTTVLDACPQGGTCRWTELPGVQLDLAIAGTDHVVALLQQSGQCAQLRVARFGPDLATRAVSAPFGPRTASTVLVAGTSSGALVATTAGGVTALYVVGADSKVSGPTSLLRGNARALIEGNGQTLLVLEIGGDYQRDNGRFALQVAVVDRRGAASTPVQVFGYQGFGYGNGSPPGAVWVGDGFLLAREQEAPARGGEHRTAIARIEKDGKITARGWLDEPSGIRATLTWDGKEARVDSRKFQPANAGCVAVLDRLGHATTKPTCTPDPTNYSLVGAVGAAKGPYLLVQNRGAAPGIEVVRPAPDGKLSPVGTFGSHGTVGIAWRAAGDALVVAWLTPAARVSEPSSLWLARMGGP